MLTSTLDIKSLKAVSKVIEDLGANVRKELKIAVSKTTKQVRIKSARKLRTVLNAPVKVLKRAIVSGKVTNDGLSAEVILRGGYKIPMKYFGARQTKKGVAFKISPTNRGVIPSAFKVNKYEGNVYRRTGKGRGLIKKEKGPAPGEVYESAGVTQVAVQTAEEQLPKQINERIRFLTIKAQGKLKK